jgi:hypothetical protein
LMPLGRGCRSAAMPACSFCSGHWATHAARFRERWRFVDTTPAHGPEPALGMSAEFEPACAFPAGAATHSRPQVCTHDDRRVRRRLAVDSSASFCRLDDSVLTPERWQWLLRGGF